ncbi:hypothetical protein ALC60_02792 [Trachymyrmex zeteki]|uniref:Uncharacterized protein n=1 Tax=Mycetomoellerius zeteki TaxID=64791 RepID=A0A151XDC2_9HYME|nr:hypothetical protein ALC60_02792 [Trachymyrmex zeteki]
MTESDCSIDSGKTPRLQSSLTKGERRNAARLRENRLLYDGNNQKCSYEFHDDRRGAQPASTPLPPRTNETRASPDIRGRVASERCGTKSGVKGNVAERSGHPLDVNDDDNDNDDDDDDDDDNNDEDDCRLRSICTCVVASWMLRCGFEKYLPEEKQITLSLLKNKS